MGSDVSGVRGRSINSPIKNKVLASLGGYQINLRGCQLVKLPGDRWSFSSVYGAPLKASGAPRVLEDSGRLLQSVLPV